MNEMHLPLKDSTARYCPGSRLLEDGTVSPTAFYLRSNERYLSVEWMEMLKKTDRINEVREVVRIFSKKLRLRTSAKIAIVHVGDACSHVKDVSGFEIRFLHEPKRGDRAHSGIHDTAQDEMLIAELIAEKVTESYPVKDFRRETTLRKEA